MRSSFRSRLHTAIRDLLLALTHCAQMERIGKIPRAVRGRRIDASRIYDKCALFSDPLSGVPALQRDTYLGAHSVFGFGIGLLPHCFCFWNSFVLFVC